jgi:hypothetical protein
MDLPIICTLTEAELKERRRTVLDSFLDSAIDVTAIENGYRCRFKPTPTLLATLSNLVELERQCCQFLTFKIVVEPQQPITLEITGPPESKSVIANFFGSYRGSTSR